MMKIKITTRKIMVFVVLFALFLMDLKVFFTVNLEGNFSREFFMTVIVTDSTTNLPLKSVNITVNPSVWDHRNQTNYAYQTDASGQVNIPLPYPLGAYYRKLNKSEFTFFSGWSMVMKRRGFVDRIVILDLPNSMLDDPHDIPPQRLKPMVVPLTRANE